MNAPAKLFTPLLRVIMPPPEGEDAKAIDVQSINADLVRWDRTRLANKWPKMEDAPIIWATFIAWAAMRRQGLIPQDLKYEEFEATALSIEPIDQTPADPTNAVPDPD
jgi:hypothetical protein